MLCHCTPTLSWDSLPNSCPTWNPADPFSSPSPPQSTIRPPSTIPVIPIRPAPASTLTSPHCHCHLDPPPKSSPNRPLAPRAHPIHLAITSTGRGHHHLGTPIYTLLTVPQPFVIASRRTRTAITLHARPPTTQAHTTLRATNSDCLTEPESDRPRGQPRTPHQVPHPPRMF